MAPGRVAGLEGGDDAQICEPGNVIGVDHFDMLDPVAAVAFFIRVLGGLIGVDRSPHGGIPDGMNSDLKP